MDLMLSCKEASRLVSEGLDRKLAMRERVTLRFHLMMCSGCTRVEKQLKFLRRAIAAMPGPEPASEEPKR